MQSKKLTDILPLESADMYKLQMFEGGYYFEANGFMTESYFNPVDACYEFIICDFCFLNLEFLKFIVYSLYE